MYTARIPPVDPAPATITAVLAMHVGHICPSSVHATFAVLPGTKAENWRSSALVAPARQPSAMDSDVGSGNISSSPFSTPSKIARATDSGEAFGMSRPRDISVSTGPGDRKSTRLNSSHLVISYAVFCLKKKKKNNNIV